MRALLPLVFLTGLSVAAVAADAGADDAVPGLLPDVSTEMLTAGYWIARHPAPDEPVMGDAEIRVFHRRLTEQGFVQDFLHPPRVLAGSRVSVMMNEIIDRLKRRILYQADGARVAENFASGFERETSAVPEKVTVEYGFVVRPSDERLLPAAEPLYERPGDIPFDQLQNSGLAIGAPVLVLHRSRDLRWCFVLDEISSGWVPAESIAMAPREVFLEHAARQRPVVVLAPVADLFLDKEMTEHLGAVRMGTVFDFKGVSVTGLEVEVPAREADGAVKFVPAFIARDDASAGYLPATSRNVYHQAFRLLHAPYGWGDRNGGQDCSRFIQMVYATVGILLPRNSSEQGRVGAMMPGFDPALPLDEKRALLAAKGLGAWTVLGMQGHILLYLGTVNGKPYVIHATWAYRDKGDDGKDRIHIAGRVVVSDLNLGAGSQKGSLLQRIVSARTLK